MAKPKSPKKTNGTKPSITPTSTAVPEYDTNLTPAETIAAAPAAGTNGNKKT